MNKYKTANGTIATEQELRSYYGSRFEEMLASGAFVKVEDGAAGVSFEEQLVIKPVAKTKIANN